MLPPRVVKLVDYASLIRRQAPGVTQQRIIGPHDTMLLPGDVGFYNDRYGVITNNLGDRIRLGDGKDVRDLAHPLSPAGRPGYAFAITDSISIAVPGRKVEASNCCSGLAIPRPRAWWATSTSTGPRATWSASR